MAAELPRPGVEVIQVFRSVSPTVITPTLVPCIVGVAKQIIELTETDDAGNSILNGDSQITLPAFLLANDGSGDPPLYAGLDGLALVLSINNGPDVTIGFSDSAASGLSPATVVSQITTAFTTAGVTAALAEVVGDGFRIRTVGTGEFQTLEVRPTTDPTVLTAFGFGIGRVVQGISIYNNRQVDIPQSNFPDPRANLDELVIENDTIRVFLATGNGTDFVEASRTQAFLRNGAVDDPAVTVEGTVDLVGSYPAIATETLVLRINGSTADTTITFASEANATALLAAINAITVPLGVTASLGTGTPNGLVLTTDLTGDGASVEIRAASTSLVLLGLTADADGDPGSGSGAVGYNIESIDDGDGNSLTSLVRFEGEDFTAAATAAVETGSVDLTTLTYPVALANKTLILGDGQQYQTVTFSAAIANEAAVVTEINAVVGTAAGGRITASLDGGNQLVLTHSEDGTDSIIDVAGGNALTDLGLTVAITRGVPDVPLPGDQLWIDGVFTGTITQVAPGGDVDVLKIDKVIAVSTDIGSGFFIDALNLPDATNRPDLTPELVVDTSGNVSLKHEILRDILGNVVDPASANIYLTYTAVRQDLSPKASQPGLLLFDDVTDLESTMSPVSAANPLALGFFFALLNAPGVQIAGIGVDAITDDAPFGTVEAFTRAAEFLEAQEVYALAPLTHDSTVAQVFNTHVNFMSEPESKGERIVLWNPEIPTHELDTLVASGTDGNSVGAGGLTFDTGLANLSALVLAAGVDPSGTIPASEGLFLDIASDDKSYSIASISGSSVTIRVTFATGENDDGFYSTTDLNDPPLLSSLIQEAFSVKVRGAELLTAGGDPDYQTTAETIQALGQTFLNRRFWMTVPDQAAAVLEGLEQIIDGFYVNAATAGMIGQNPPQQSFTNFPISGFTRVIGTSPNSKKFTERQLNIMAAGGAYIYVQDVEGGPLTSRMALTTDLTSIETRTDSITKVVDFTAKFMRRGLRNFIGRFNITQGFLDSLGSVIQGLIGFLVETGVLIGGNLNNLIQDEDAPDTVLVDITLDVPFPANYIRLTLVV